MVLTGQNGLLVHKFNRVDRDLHVARHQRSACLPAGIKERDISFRICSGTIEARFASFDPAYALNIANRSPGTRELYCGFPQHPYIEHVDNPVIPTGYEVTTVVGPADCIDATSVDFLQQYSMIL